MTAASLRPGPFVLAIAVAVALVLSAPFVGQVRSAVRREFPGHFLLIVGGAVAVGVGFALAAAIWRIRDRRAARFGAIAGAILIAMVYSAWNATEFPESNAVERFHFLQYGLITFLFYRAWRPLADGAVFVLPLLAGLIVGTAEEWFQWFVPARVGEIKDVFLNLVAIGTGLIFSAAVDPPPRLTAKVGKGSRPRVRRMSIAALLAVAAFVHTVHLGSRVEAPGVGSFMSRYSGSQLLALQDDRRRAWMMSPPPTALHRLSREDQYLSEGIEHVRERNELWAAGGVRGAWQENRILETYFQPVLDTPTHHGAGHRWPPEQRADAESRAAAEAAPFVSAAYPNVLWAWPPLLLWSGVLLLALGIAIYS